MAGTSVEMDPFVCPSGAKYLLFCEGEYACLGLYKAQDF